MTLTAKDVAEIAKLLEESSFDELDLEIDGVKLSLRRGGARGTGSASSAGSAGGSSSASAVAPASTGPASSAGGGDSAGTAQAAGSAAPGGAAASAPRGAVPAPSRAADPNIHEVPAPLLGTFYRAPKPGASPFVEIGSAVEEETIVGIIEVMKLMNTVRAGVRGRVTEILARDGALVEYGETLLRVGKTG